MTAGHEMPLRHYRYDTDLPGDAAWMWTSHGPHAARIPLHDHDFLEFELVDGGRAEHVSIHGRQQVRTGHLSILHPGQWHGYEQVRDFVIYDIYFPLGLFARELSWMQADARLAPMFPLRVPRDDAQRRAAPQGVLTLFFEPALLARVRSCCADLHRLTRNGALRNRAKILAHSLLLFDAIADHPQLLEAQRRVVDPRIDAVCAAMASELAKPWSVRELARTVGISASHLMRLMTRITGRSPISWLLQRRAEHLAVLLLTRSDSVAELGREVGWADPSYCARRFRACLGCSPDEYRHRFSSAQDASQAGAPRRA
jgi:AraC-like DNA-binding protein